MNRHQRASRGRPSPADGKARPTSSVWVLAALTVLVVGSVACSNSSSTGTTSAAGAYKGVGGAEVPNIAFTVNGYSVKGLTADVLAACTYANGGTAEQVLTFPDPNPVTSHVDTVDPDFHDFSDTYTVAGAAGVVIQVTVVGKILLHGDAFGTIEVSTIKGLQPGCRTPTGPADWILLKFRTAPKSDSTTAP